MGLGEDSDNNTLSGNEVYNNGQSGIILDYGDNNTILNNEIYNNTHHGISLTNNADDNNITDNIFLDNGDTGVKIDSVSDNNLVYKNFFRGNARHAIDDGTGNQWANGVIGNYWDNYTNPAIGGVDNDGNGIGDVNYKVYTTNWLPKENDTLPIWDT